MTFAESYAYLDEWVITALKSLGIDAFYQPLNDITSPKGKIGGAAQKRLGGGAVLHHVTMSYDMDGQKMVQVLRIGREKLSDKGTTSAAKRVDPLRSQTGLSRAAIIERMTSTFTSLYGATPGTVARRGARARRGPRRQQVHLAGVARPRPVTDGSRTARRLSRLEQPAQLDVVAVTADSSCPAVPRERRLPRDEVAVVGMRFDPLVDERAERHDALGEAGAGVVERPLDELAAEAVAAHRGIHLGVGEQDAVFAQLIVGESELASVLSDDEVSVLFGYVPNRLGHQCLPARMS